jgi:hypothetical protein
MSPTDYYFDAIDSARVQRVKELSEIKRTFGSTIHIDPMSIGSKSVIVLTYAAWEGFYNECVGYYFDFLDSMGLKIKDVSWLLLSGALVSQFNNLRDRHHSDVARRDFVSSLKDRLICGFDQFDRSVVMARSNLNFERLSSNFLLLSMNLSQFHPFRIRIDKELVGWRHAVAHGNPPDLSMIDVASHVDFASSLLLVISDCFQEAMVQNL